MGCHVAATSRSTNGKDAILAAGADEFVLDDGHLASGSTDSGSSHRGKYDAILELIGTTTLVDSLACAAPGGKVCMTGIVGNAWSMDGFKPMEDIPSGVCLTRYSGGGEEFKAVPWEKMVNSVEEGKMKVVVGKTFPLEEVVRAHELMEENKARGKIVLLM